MKFFLPNPFRLAVSLILFVIALGFLLPLATQHPEVAIVMIFSGINFGMTFLP